MTPAAHHFHLAPPLAPPMLRTEYRSISTASTSRRFSFLGGGARDVEHDAEAAADEDRRRMGAWSVFAEMDEAARGRQRGSSSTYAQQRHHQQAEHQRPLTAAMYHQSTQPIGEDEETAGSSTDRQPGESGFSFTSSSLGTEILNGQYATFASSSSSSPYRSVRSSPINTYQSAPWTMSQSPDSRVLSGDDAGRPLVQSPPQISSSFFAPPSAYHSFSPGPGSIVDHSAEAEDDEEGSVLATPRPMQLSLPSPPGFLLAAPPHPNQQLSSPGGHPPPSPNLQFPSSPNPSTPIRRPSGGAAVSSQPAPPPVLAWYERDLLGLDRVWVDVFKCALSYTLASLFTFNPTLNQLLPSPKSAQCVPSPASPMPLRKDR